MSKNYIVILSLLMVMTVAIDATGQSSHWSATDKFRNCVRSMQSTNDELIRFNYAMNYFLTEHATTVQLQDACHYLSTDEKKYALGVAAYPNIIDKDHFYVIYDSFSRMSWAIKLYHNTQEKQQFTAFETDYQLDVVKDLDDVHRLLMDKGDLLLSNNQFDEALLIYQQALEIKPSDQQTMNMISEVATTKQELAAILEAESKMKLKFNNLILSGDELLSVNKVGEAISMYEQAMELMPGDDTAYLRIKEANNWKQELSNVMLEEQEKRSQYDFLIQKGDILISAGNYNEAISIFEQASALFPNEQLPYAKMEEARRLSQEFIDHNSVCFTSDEDFGNIKRSIEGQMFSDEKMEMARKHTQKNCLSIEQMKAIIAIFSMDDDKLEMIKYMYDHSNEQNRFYEFRDDLRFSSAQRELDEFLVNKN